MKVLERLGWQGEHRLIGISLKEEDSAHLVVCKRSQGTVRITESQQFSDSLSLQHYLKQAPGVPLVLFLQPEVWVEKWIAKDIDSPLTQVMGIGVEDPSQFVIQVVSGETQDFYSVCRRSTLEERVSRLGVAAARVINLFISPGIVCSLLPALSQYDVETAYRLKIAEGTYDWHGGRKPRLEVDAPQPLQLDDLSYGLEMKDWQVVPYAAVLQHYLQGHEGQTGLSFLAKQAQTQQHYALWTRALGYVGLLLLVGLSLGFAWQRYALWQMQENEQVVRANRSLLDQIADNESQIQAQYTFVKGAATGTLKPTRWSQQLDELLAFVPADMYLRKWMMRPTEAQLKKIDMALIEVAPDMLLQGEARNAASLAKLPQDWQRLPFVARTEIWQANYVYESQWQDFTLLLWLADE